MKLKSELLSVLTESAVTFLIELLPLLMIIDGVCGHCCHCWPLSMLIDADKNFDGCCLSLGTKKSSAVIVFVAGKNWRQIGTRNVDRCWLSLVPV